MSGGNNRNVSSSTTYIHIMQSIWENTTVSACNLHAVYRCD